MKTIKFKTHSGRVEDLEAEAFYDGGGDDAEKRE